ncbi:hypothetical protein CCR75_007808 [Bremia lactucae]|uniref:Uncharacterized protein n=1 Tax=Bremia lactucae TaxID=4779 RepID=A0A976IL03_BRELC|nr:hypothetical protein CCR75_007808 [Bremia lactucae]
MKVSVCGSVLGKGFNALDGEKEPQQRLFEMKEYCASRRPPVVSRTHRAQLNARYPNDEDDFTDTWNRRARSVTHISAYEEQYCQNKGM